MLEARADAVPSEVASHLVQGGHGGLLRIARSLLHGTIIALISLADPTQAAVPLRVKPKPAQFGKPAHSAAKPARAATPGGHGRAVVAPKSANTLATRAAKPRPAAVVGSRPTPPAHKALRAPSAPARSAKNPDRVPTPTPKPALLGKPAPWWGTLVPATPTPTPTGPGSAPAAPRKPPVAADKPTTLGDLPSPEPVVTFAAFIADLWPAAAARGVSRGTFEAAFKGVNLDPKTVRRTRAGQSELVTPIWQYLASKIAPYKIDAGNAAARTWKKTLDGVEEDFGIPREIVLAVWGMESGFGEDTGKQSTIRVLATLAFTKYRDGLFREELLDALQILQAGDITPARMIGSWAGAMGQTQFLPSSFLKYAVDYDGDGRRDIWGDVPDALASTANFLKSQGWTSGLAWGFEVNLPKGFDASHYEETKSLPFSRWRERGVERPAGIALPKAGEATLLIPAGMHGPAFLVTANFHVIKTYNFSTSYALSVALLGERLAGRPALKAEWPVGQKLLSVAEARELQSLLKTLGYDVGDIDGKIGEQVRDAILAYQGKTGQPQEGVADLALLEKLRATQ